MTYVPTSEPFDTWELPRLLAIADGLRPESVAAEGQAYGPAAEVLAGVRRDLLGLRGKVTAALEGAAGEAVLGELTRLDTLADAGAADTARAGRALDEHAGQVATTRTDLGWVQGMAVGARSAAMALPGAAGAAAALTGDYVVDPAAQWYAADYANRYQDTSNANYAGTYPAPEPPGISPAAAGGAPVGGTGSPGIGAPGVDGPGTGASAVAGIGAAGAAFAPVVPGPSPAGTGMTGAMPGGAGAMPGGAGAPGAGTPGAVAPGVPPATAPGHGTAGAGRPTVPAVRSAPPAVPPPATAGAWRPGSPWTTGSTAAGRAGIGGPGRGGFGAHPDAPTGGGRGGPAGPGPAQQATHPSTPGSPRSTGYGGVPLGVGTGVGAGGEPHERPDWLLQDDADAIWFAGLPEYSEPVISRESHSRSV